MLLTFFLVSITVSASSGDTADLVAQEDVLVTTKNYSEVFTVYDHTIFPD